MITETLKYDLFTFKLKTFFHFYFFKEHIFCAFFLFCQVDVINFYFFRFWPKRVFSFIFLISNHPNYLIKTFPNIFSLWFFTFFDFSFAHIFPWIFIRVFWLSRRLFADLMIKSRGFYVLFSTFNPLTNLISKSLFKAYVTGFWS